MIDFQWIGILAVPILVQAGAMLYWGGEIRQMLREHERRLNVLEEHGDA